MTVGLKIFATDPEPETPEPEEANETVFWSPAWKKKAAEAAFTALLLTGIVALNLLPVGTLPSMLDWYLLARVAGVTWLSVFTLNMGIDYRQYLQTK